MSVNSKNNSDKTEEKKEKKMWTSKTILTHNTGERPGGRGSERKGFREEEEEEKKEEEKDEETSMNLKKTWYSLTLFFHLT